MTPEEAFIKAAAETLTQHKLASIGRFLAKAKGLSGITKALDSGGVTGAWDHLTDAFHALPQTTKAQLLGQVGGGVVGGIGGYALTDDDASGAQALANTALGMFTGGMAGKALGKKLPNMLGGAPGAEGVAEGATMAGSRAAPTPSPAKGAPAPEAAPTKPRRRKAPAKSNKGAKPKNTDPA